MTTPRPRCSWESQWHSTTHYTHERFLKDSSSIARGSSLTLEQMLGLLPCTPHHWARILRLWECRVAMISVMRYWHSLRGRDTTSYSCAQLSVNKQDITFLAPYLLARWWRHHRQQESPCCYTTTQERDTQGKWRTKQTQEGEQRPDAVCPRDARLAEVTQEHGQQHRSTCEWRAEGDQKQERSTAGTVAVTHTTQPSHKI